MVKTILTFLVIFSFLFAGIGYLVIIFHNNYASFPLPFQNTPTPTHAPVASLTLTPETTMISKLQTNTVDIVFDSPHNTNFKPKIIQMEIAFDPMALEDVTISPGDFFTDPSVALNIIDSNTGRISYALQTAKENQKTHGIVARLSFTPNPVFSGIQTPLSFLGKTMIRDTANENISTATYGTKLIVASGSATIQNNPISK